MLEEKDLEPSLIEGITSFVIDVDKLDQMGGISIDCLEMIFSYLDCFELMRIAMTCKRWSYVAYSVIRKQKRLVVNGTLPWLQMVNVVKVLKMTNLSALEISLKRDIGWRNFLKFQELLTARHVLLRDIVKHCPNLKELNGCMLSWKKQDAAPFFTRLPNLTHLNLNNNCLTEPILSIIISNCKSLLFLDISGNAEITGKCLVNKSAIYNLTHFDLHNCALTEQVFDAIFSNCRSLKFLDVSKNKEITGECLSKNSSNSLKSLHVGFCDEWVLEFKDIHRSCPVLEELTISTTGCVGISFEEIFRRDYGRKKLDPEEKDVMSSLKVLHMQSMDADDELYEFRMKGPVHTRTPNLETLVVTDNCLCCEMFLINLSKYCPKLKSLDVSGSALVSFYNLFDTNYFVHILEPLNGLEILAFNSVTDFFPHDITESFARFGGSDLDRCVDIFSSHLKQLKVLELSEYPDLTNEHVVQLIVNLTELKELKIQLCPKVDNGLLSQLTDHPEFDKRKQQLLLMVNGTEIVRDAAVVPDKIKLDFEWKHRSYKSCFRKLSLRRPGHSDDDDSD